VVKRYSNCDVILFCIPAFLAYKIGIIEYVVVGECGSFRPAGRSRSELNVGWVVTVNLGREEIQVGGFGNVCVVREPINHLGCRIEANYSFKGGESVRSQVEWVAMLHLWQNGLNYLDVVQVSKFIIHEKDTKSDLVNGIGKLVALIGGIYVHQDQIGHGSCHLHHYPFKFIVGIYPDPILRLQIELFNQTSCKFSSFFIKLLVSESHVLRIRVQSHAIRIAFSFLAEEVDGGDSNRLMVGIPDYKTKFKPVEMLQRAGFNKACNGPLKIFRKHENLFIHLHNTPTSVKLTTKAGWLLFKA
jgi:hypothetical protein